jgi:hypothetical protein
MNSNINLLIVLVASIVLITLCINRRETYNDPKILEIRNNLMRIDPEVTSKLNIQASNQSFTEDKRDMYLCLRDKKTGQYYPDNMLNYVAIHELAHAKSKEIDTNHTSNEFRENFDKYLERASELGIYNQNEPLIDEYCGVTKDTK